MQKKTVALRAAVVELLAILGREVFRQVNGGMTLNGLILRCYSAGQLKRMRICTKANV